MIFYYCKVIVVFFDFDHGGRHFMPRGDGYAPYMLVEGDDRQLAVRVLGVPNEAKFGELVHVRLHLMYHPRVNYGHLHSGTHFRLMEGHKVIGQGTVDSEILNEDS